MPRNSELQRYRNEVDIPISITASATELNKLDGFSPLSFINTGVAVTTQTDNYTATLTDANTCLYFGVATTKTFTIPANDTVAFPIGTIFIVAKATGALTLAVTTDTLIGCTGTVPQNTASIVIKVAPTTWVHLATA